MKSLSEIETVSKRSSKAAGFSWGIAEEVGKNIRMLEFFGLNGIKGIIIKSMRDFYKDKYRLKGKAYTYVVCAIIIFVIVLFVIYLF